LHQIRSFYRLASPNKSTFVSPWMIKYKLIKIKLKSKQGRAIWYFENKINFVFSLHGHLYTKFEDTHNLVSSLNIQQYDFKNWRGPLHNCRQCWSSIMAFNSWTNKSLSTLQKVIRVKNVSRRRIHVSYISLVNLI